jgi:hypothetical protein
MVREWSEKNSVKLMSARKINNKAIKSMCQRRWDLVGSDNIYLREM